MELFAEGYDFYIGKSIYFTDTQLEAWQWVLESHLALDSVLSFEKKLTEKMGSDQKYAFENRNNVLVRAYSKAFCTAYHQMLAGMVERRMRASILRVGSVWYTAWIDAGQPDLKKLIDKEIVPEKEEEDKKLKITDRESGEIGAVLNPAEMLFGACCGHGMGDCHSVMPKLDGCQPSQPTDRAKHEECKDHGH